MGLKMGMPYREILLMEPGELVDCATSYAIACGSVREKFAYTFDEVMEMK